MAKEKTWCVYIHTAPNGKVYVGITSQKPEIRWQNGKGYKSNKHFANAIDKYGWDNFTHEVLVNGLTQEQAEQRETELIAFHNSANKSFGYNRALGGHALSEESRKKIGNTRKERIALGLIKTDYDRHFSEETKRKISEARKGKPGKPWTDEQKKHMSQMRTGTGNPRYGKPPSDKCKAAALAANEKPVMKIDGKAKTLYRSAKEAGVANNIDNTNITRCCKGQRATAGGYVWCYA